MGAQLASRGRYRPRAGPEHGLTLDGFHEGASPGVCVTASLATVDGQKIVGLRHDRAPDRDADPVEPGDVADARDSEAPRQGTRAANGFIRRNRSRPMGLGRALEPYHLLLLIGTGIPAAD
jgi:hypothetical protein